MVCEWYNNPLVAPDGQAIGVASMVLDITERKRAEEEQQKFVALIENRGWGLPSATRLLQKDMVVL